MHKIHVIDRFEEGQQNKSWKSISINFCIIVTRQRKENEEIGLKKRIALTIMSFCNDGIILTVRSIPAFSTVVIIHVVRVVVIGHDDAIRGASAARWTCRRAQIRARWAGAGSGNLRLVVVVEFTVDKSVFTKSEFFARLQYAIAHDASKTVYVEHFVFGAHVKVHFTETLHALITFCAEQSACSKHSTFTFIKMKAPCWIHVISSQVKM